MTSNKETIFSTLYTRMTEVSGVLTSGRKVRHYDDVQPVEQPALFIEQVSSDIQSRPNGPGKQTLKANVILYAWSDSDLGPMPIINGLVDQVEGLMKRYPTEPAPSQTTTLSGTVASAQVVNVEYAGGNLGNQGVAIVSIEMLTTS